MVLEIFTSANCPFSPRAIRIAQSVLSAYDNISLKVTDVVQNRPRAKEMHIDAAPTLVFNNQIIYVGAPTADELNATLQQMTQLSQKQHSDSSNDASEGVLTNDSPLQL